MMTLGIYATEQAYGQAVNDGSWVASAYDCEDYDAVTRALADHGLALSPRQLDKLYEEGELNLRAGTLRHIWIRDDE